MLLLVIVRWWPKSMHSSYIDAHIGIYRDLLYIHIPAIMIHYHDIEYRLLFCYRNVLFIFNPVCSILRHITSYIPVPFHWYSYLKCSFNITFGCMNALHHQTNQNVYLRFAEHVAVSDRQTIQNISVVNWVWASMPLTYNCCAVVLLAIWTFW